jgi:2-keto-4-pentenoate hydratase/2-oxohepta-3-ene-1,7-dioic acid hydratase in catechol pathway
VAAIIEFLSQSTTLLPGTAIFTGTPHGVGMAQNPPLWLKQATR